jgi:hypothetical protein
VELELGVGTGRWGAEEVGAEELVELGVRQRRTGGTRSEAVE